MQSGPAPAGLMRTARSQSPRKKREEKTMTNHPNRNKSKSIKRKLESDPKLYATTRYAMALGAGTILNWAATSHRDDLDRQSIIWSLEDAIAEPHPTEWETEIAQLVVSNSLDKLVELCRTIQADHPNECPSGRNVSRVKYRARTNDYRCYLCGDFWPKF